MIIKNMNIIRLAIVGVLFSVSFLTQANDRAEKVVMQKNINWGNAIKTTVLSGTSLLGAWFYYKTIVEPYVIDIIKYEGLDCALTFNKDFVLSNPGIAVLYATPLFLAVFQAILARDYAKKIWNEKVQ